VVVTPVDPEVVDVTAGDVVVVGDVVEVVVPTDAVAWAA
jgi:hypothetical protein